MEVFAVEGLVAPLRAAIDGLLGADLCRLSSAELTELLRSLEEQRRRLTRVDQRVVSEVDQRGVAHDYARSGAADLLIDMLRVAPAEAKARVTQARELQPTQMPSGEVVPALLPRCADAVAEGVISTAHVAVISRTIGRIPAAIAFEAAPVAEAMLVEAARHQHPAAVERTAAMLLARLDPDGTAPREDEIARRRDFSMRRRADGSAQVRGEWTAELAAISQAIVDSLAAPRPAADGMADDRSAGQRRHDAMLEAGLRLLRSDSLPAAGGTPVTVVLRVEADLVDAADAANATGLRGPGDSSEPGDRSAQPVGTTGAARGSTGEIWPLSCLRANLGDVAVVPILINHDGAALMCGRTQRFATRAQRLALAARDGGCVFPSCDRPAAWCEVHHVIEWRLGGATDIANLCLLCTYHHREFERRGWVVRMAAGVPEWLPPPWIDPEQRPMRNRSHHPPDLDFRVDEDVGCTA